MCYMRSKTAVNQASVLATGTSQRALGPNPLRIGLTLCSHKTVLVTYSWKQPAVHGTGYVLSAGQQPLHLSREQYGDAICQEMQAISSAADATPFSIVEVMKYNGVDDAT